LTDTVVASRLRSCFQPRFLALLLAIGATGGCSSAPDRPAAKAALAPCGWLPNCVNSASGRGVAAFVAIWRRLPRYRPLAWAVVLPGVFWLAEQAYSCFARRRWNGCRDQICGKP